MVPGDMGRYSYLLMGTEKAMEETFGSTCHGAGRRMSRTAAVKAARGRRIDAELAAQGVVARAAGYESLAEEMPEDGELAPTIGALPGSRPSRYCAADSLHHSASSCA